MGIAVKTISTLIQNDWLLGLSDFKGGADIAREVSSILISSCHLNPVDYLYFKDQ